MYNMDETSLVWKILPNKTLVNKNEKSISGKKVKKTCTYNHNKNTWMCTTIFQLWHHDGFNPRVSR
ncbi:hypothetical protein WN51_00071 [Melipona quadrifasciata]|uniref:DDE-1 domain-containing protein n=1 Tax=Melipona quadrifasciata TaxID=166423 RepID=A0A0M8ZMG5_9HYME|nr:hypothetical protein WN51_00071 [Melipona quadrifasciata]